jgi:hypothetical protein
LAVGTAADQAAACEAVGAVDANSNLWSQPPVDATGVTLNIGSQSNDFGGIPNPVGFFGLNVDKGGAPLDPSQPSVAFGVEQNYKELEANSALLMESYIQFCEPDFAYKRPFFSKYDKAEKRIVNSTVSADMVNITTSNSDAVAYFARGNFFLAPNVDNELTSLTIGSRGSDAVARLQFYNSGSMLGSVTGYNPGNLQVKASSLELVGEQIQMFATNETTRIASFVPGRVSITPYAAGGTSLSVGTADPWRFISELSDLKDNDKFAEDTKEGDLKADQFSALTLGYNGVAAFSAVAIASSITTINVGRRECIYLYGSVSGQPGNAISVGGPDNSAAITGIATQAGQKSVVARGIAGQAANVFEAQNSAQVPLVSVPATGGLVIGNSVLPPTTTTGFFYVPQLSGAPTGIPVVQPGTTPIAFDDANQKLMVFTGGVWKSVAVV